MTTSQFFTPLSERIDTLPLVLAGPVVRRVEPDSVSVWVALRRPAEVRSRVLSLDGLEVFMEGTRHTVPVGEHLHIVTVTATGTTLERARVYGYDLGFDLGCGLGCGLGSGLDHDLGHGLGRGAAADATFESLFAPGVVADDPDEARSSLLYNDGPAWPSFVVPPAEVEDLRMIHGSCRRPNRDGLDAMPAIDEIIENSMSLPAERPHMFFHTGDIIYSDGASLPTAFLDLLSDTAEILLGWNEYLPGVQIGVNDLALGQRFESHLQHAGLPEPALIQLYGLGEYLAMHLLVVSPTLWPADFPDDEHTRAIGRLHDGLARVRRALANISAYAVFDDHDVADDWNLVQDWCERVHDKPLGRRIVLNGLMAFALCHAWGNEPEAFAAPAEPGGDGHGDGPGDDHDHGDGPGEPAPGFRLLQLIRSWRPQGPSLGGMEADSGATDGDAPGSADAAVEGELQRLLSIPESREALHAHGAPPRLWHHEGAIDWHFRLRAPGYEILSLDLRTWRAFPGPTPLSLPDLLSEEALAAQLPHAPEGDDPVPVTIVISSIPMLSQARTRMSKWLKYGGAWYLGVFGPLRAHTTVRQCLTYYPDQGDIWSRGSPSFARLAARLAPRKRIVCLAGDIHRGFAARMAYASGEQRAVFAQLTSSGMINERFDIHWYHRYGYNYPWPWCRRPRPERGALDDGASYIVEYLRADKQGKEGREFVGKNNIGEVLFARRDDALVVEQRTWWHDDDGAGMAPRSPFTVVLDET